MAVTRSSASERQQAPSAIRSALPPRSLEFAGLLGATLAIAFGLTLIYNAKVAPAANSTSAVLNINTLQSPEPLVPLLSFIESQSERQYVARRAFAFIQEANGKLPNVGALSRIRVPAREVASTARLDGLRARLPQARASDSTVALFTQREVALLKPALSVRSYASYRRSFLIWAPAMLAVFFLVHFAWRFRGFAGEQVIVPTLQALSGIGFILMVTLRDPLRDTLAFADFSQSVCMAVLLMGVIAFVDVERIFAGLSYIPLILAVLLSITLILFGSGPGTSDAKVNLLGFQPVELIKILIVLFLAGYFARRWEFLRVLKEKRPELAAISRHVEIPRFEYLLPVLAAMVLTLVFFFLQRDLGPALIISCVFLALYAVARSRALLAFSGLLLLLGGFLGGYFLKQPRTVHDRVSMWLSPWDNAVRGGEQVVHSMWSFATGGPFGTGLGLGDPDLMPAAHTDLILAVLGEEWGFVGVLIVFILYGVLIWTGLKIAMRAASDYGFFLALGLTLLIALGVVLISGGVLDLAPLSGVVTPFLSYGGTAMLANFAVAGVLLSLSRSRSDGELTRPFRKPVRRLAQVLGCIVIIILGKAAWLQLVRADATVGAGTLTLQADGARRYLYNPRLLAIARSIPRGTIFDRNGLPLATSDWKEIQAHQNEYVKLGVTLDPPRTGEDTRFYPLGAAAVHLLGDLRSRANWGARNASLIERDSMVRLQGFNDRAAVVPVPDPRTGNATYTIRYDLRELVPLLRHKSEPQHPAVLRVLNRERDVKTTIDARLQLRAAKILQARLQKLGRKKGALVVLDSETGDLLASVSYPMPSQMPPVLGPDDGVDEMLDRARYGLYPPGSTFKIVTALAALRKDPANANATFDCRPLGDGRVGNTVRGWGRPIRDDVADKAAHGNVDMSKGIVVSCNAYFAQLGTYRVGAEALRDTAGKLGISVATPNTADKLKDALPQAAYGQGQVVASPFQMARVAATIASGGNVPHGRWVLDESNSRTEAPQRLVGTALASSVGQYMRGVVTSGTGRAANAAAVPIAGKTGTAELESQPSHAWFIGYAPFGGARKLAFAVLVENGQYGGSAAAPIAGDIMTAAAELGLFKQVGADQK